MKKVKGKKLSLEKLKIAKLDSSKSMIKGGNKSGSPDCPIYETVTCETQFTCDSIHVCVVHTVNCNPLTTIWGS